MIDVKINQTILPKRSAPNDDDDDNNNNNNNNDDEEQDCFSFA